MEVGIVIPAYNPRSHDYLRAIDSVRVQSHASWECVVVDDGSRSPLPEVRDPRVHVVRQDNRGVSAARNRGAATVGGEYLAFLDQDDHWAPQKLERQLEFMRRHDLAVCDTGFHIIRDDCVIADGYPDHGGEFCRLLASASIGLSTLIVRRDAFEQVGGFDPLLPKVQDWGLVLALTHAGYRLRRLPEVLCTYHLHDANATRDYRRTYAEKMALYDLYEALDGRRHVRRAITAGRASTRRVYAYQAIDAFRADRRFPDLAWAAARRPDIVATAIARYGRKRMPVCGG